ncbi:hypothetical protein PFICI_01368 [Pestalotiopsis fici W106-1]|uniref:Uncharacterized protein n=1 Tax=Pestalotiopsis fici (strain W106-1 / CGMCC3.15140) TaxID=1229662 RepID=W3XNK9_PESFW|nr:uncharacterized protein PFICI_01368 [Pestalotiopsis fici W106-1]ETS87540.1 hypothetical protein PFICI_01368 [Pestalotiopsis fici W106-1]
MSSSSTSKEKTLQNDDEHTKTLQELEHALAAWKEYVFEAEYNIYFGAFDQHARLRGEGAKITPVVEAQAKLSGPFKNLDEQSNEWEEEVKRRIAHEEWEENGRKVSWKSKGVDGCDQFLDKYCPPTR